MCGVLGPFPDFFFFWTGHTLWGKKNLECVECDRKKKVLAVAHTTLRCLFLYDMFSPSD